MNLEIEENKKILYMFINMCLFFFIYLVLILEEKYIGYMFLILVK